VSALLPVAGQKIRGGLHGPGELPLSFLPLGQRFVFDSLVFMKVTYGSLPQKRMMPSPLDVASAVFKNPAADVLLQPEFAAHGYRNELEAVKKEGDAAGPDLWEGSLYHGWLQALRELSPDPQNDEALPAVFRTEAWQRRMLDTQLASWAELRHDTVLYAKQSFTAMALCEYPDGYVDPYPRFFAGVQRMATRGQALVNGMDFGTQPKMKKRIVEYFGQLGEVAGHLRGMAERERANQPLTGEQVEFLNDAVAMRGRSAGCTTEWTPEGWYASLYYDRDEVSKHEPVISDVHTQPTDENGNPVGKVLHVGTGRPRLITVRIETCKGPRVYRGLVSSYYELITQNFERLTDEVWWSRLANNSAPPEEPAWTQDFVVR
jgi:hypothetical protein